MLRIGSFKIFKGCECSKKTATNTRMMMTLIRYEKAIKARQCTYASVWISAIVDEPLRIQ